MRVINAIEELWTLGGEPSDLDPWLAAADPYTGNPDTGFDINSRGVAYYLEQLSRAQVAIANWRKTDGHEVRFKKFIESKNVFVGLEDNTFDFRKYGTYGMSVPSTEFFPGATGVQTGDYGIFENAAINLQGVTYTVINAEYDASINGGSVLFTFYEAVVWTQDDLGVDLPSIEGDISMNWFKIDRSGINYDDGFYLRAPTELIDILKMYDGPSSKRMNRPANKDSLYTMPPVVGIPSLWYVIGDRLYLDSYLDERRYYKIEYYRVPAQLEAATLAELSALEFEIPTYFHEPLILWGEWRQARRQQEWDKAYAIKRDLQEIIERMSTENSLDFLRDESYGFYVQWEETT